MWFLGVLLAVACHAPAPTATFEGSTFDTRQDPTRLTLGPNDRIRVTVLGHPELSSPQDGVRVGPTGEIQLPLLGTIRVEGRSPRRLRASLIASYSVYMREPRVTVTILEHASQRFHLLGKVEFPGPKIMDRPLNALEAVSQGGQMTLGADRSTVYILRPHPARADRGPELEVHAFDTATPDAGGLVQVLAGDILLVQAKGTQNIKEDVLPFIAALGLNAYATISLIDDD